MRLPRGVRLVNATGTSLERIEKFVNEINVNVDAIATGANEQASSLSEINNAVNQLDQATQQNAGLVSSITAAGDIMALGAAKMKTLVDIFKLNRRTAPREPGSGAAAGGPQMRGRQNIAA
jgi:methyl-accepting chemotaxis protein